MMLETYIFIFSFVVTAIIIFVLLFTHRINKRYEFIFNNEHEMKFVSKNINGIHSKYDFSLKNGNIEIYISIIDKKDLKITMLNYGKKPIHMECNNKNISRYKHANLLFVYLINNLDKWAL